MKAPDDTVFLLDCDNTLLDSKAWTARNSLRIGSRAFSARGCPNRALPTRIRSSPRDRGTHPRQVQGFSRRVRQARLPKPAVREAPVPR